MQVSDISPALVGKRVRIEYTQKYTSGRSETRVESGKVLEVTKTGIEIQIKPLSLPGFGACPTSSTISQSKITKIVKL